MTQAEFIEKYAPSDSDDFKDDLDDLLIIAKRVAWHDGYDEGFDAGNGECE